MSIKPGYPINKIFMIYFITLIPQHYYKYNFLST